MSNSMNFKTIISLIYKPFNSWNQFKITTCNGERFIIPYLPSLKKRVSDCQEYFYRFRQICLPMGHNRSNSVQRSANGHTGHSIFRGRHIRSKWGTGRRRPSTFNHQRRLAEFSGAEAIAYGNRRHSQACANRSPTGGCAFRHPPGMSARQGIAAAKTRKKAKKGG